MRTNTTTTVVIAAGAVLAAVIVTRTPAQQEYGGLAGVCCLPSGGCRDDLGVTGCDSNGGVFLGEGSTCIGSQCPSVAPPTVVSTSVTPRRESFSSVRIYRSWSDGQVDVTWLSFQASAGGPDNCVVNASPAQCGPVVLIPGTCPTDIDRNGDTGINDFLALLGGWGECR